MLDTKESAHRRGNIYLGICIMLICLSTLLGIGIYLFSKEYHFNKSNPIIVILYLIELIVFVLFFSGLELFINGLKSSIVNRKGDEDNESLIRLWHERKTFASHTYYRFYIEFQYVTKEGRINYQIERISLKEFEILHRLQMIPIKVYKERAIFNRSGLSQLEVE